MKLPRDGFFADVDLPVRTGTDPDFLRSLELVLAVVERAERDAAQGDQSAQDWLAWLRDGRR
jgi:hypothetical protein